MSGGWLDEYPEPSQLARYNAEVARGLVHTDEWRALMAALQSHHDERERRRMERRAATEVDYGIWMTTETVPRRRWWRRG